MLNGIFNALKRVIPSKKTKDQIAIRLLRMFEVGTVGMNFYTASALYNDVTLFTQQNPEAATDYNMNVAASAMYLYYAALYLSQKYSLPNLIKWFRALNLMVANANLNYGLWNFFIAQIYFAKGDVDSDGNLNINPTLSTGLLYAGIVQALITGARNEYTKQMAQPFADKHKILSGIYRFISDFVTYNGLFFGLIVLLRGKDATVDELLAPPTSEEIAAVEIFLTSLPGLLVSGEGVIDQTSSSYREWKQGISKKIQEALGWDSNGDKKAWSWKDLLTAGGSSAALILQIAETPFKATTGALDAALVASAVTQVFSSTPSETLNSNDPESYDFIHEHLKACHSTKRIGIDNEHLISEPEETGSCNPFSGRVDLEAGSQQQPAPQTTSEDKRTLQQLTMNGSW